MSHGETMLVERSALSKVICHYKGSIGRNYKGSGEHEQTIVNDIVLVKFQWIAAKFM